MSAAKHERAVNAATLNNIGVVLQRKGKIESALKYFDDAVNSRILSLSKGEYPSAAVREEKDVLTENCIIDETGESHADGLSESLCSKSLPQNIVLDMLPSSTDSCLKESTVGRATQNEELEFSNTIKIGFSCGHKTCFSRQKCNEYRASSITLYNLGLVHHQLHNLQRSIELFRMALFIGLKQRKCSGEESDELSEFYGTILNNIGQLQYRMGDLNSALGSFFQALRYVDYLETPPGDEVNLPRGWQHCIRISLSGICRVLFHKGEMSKAVEFATEHFRMCRIVYGKDDINVAVAHYNLGVLFQEQGRALEALELCAPFLCAAQSKLGDHDLRLATARHTVGVICFQLGAMDKALKFLTQSLEARKKAYGYKHLTVVETQFYIAKIYVQKGFYEHALSLFNRTLQGMQQPTEACYGFWLQLDMLCDMGEIHLSRGQPKLALQVYTKAVEMAEELNGDAVTVVRLLTMVGSVQLAMGQKEEGHYKLAQASEICAEYFDENELANDWTVLTCGDFIVRGGAPSA